MKGKNDGVIESVGGFEEFGKLVKRGRQMHDQAVFELFSQLLSNAVSFLKRGSHILTRKRDHRPGLYIKQQNPV